MPFDAGAVVGRADFSAEEAIKAFGQLQRAVTQLPKGTRAADVALRQTASATKQLDLPLIYTTADMAKLGAASTVTAAQLNVVAASASGVATATATVGAAAAVTGTRSVAAWAGVQGALASFSSRLGDASDQWQSQIGRMSQALSTVSTKMLIVGTVGVAAFGYMTKMAADAVESENLFAVSMGETADKARAWSEQLRKDLGLNAYELRKNVGILNVMLTAMGQSEAKAYDMATSMVKLTYDMASFYNLPVEEAFMKIQSGISGETEPLKRLGIVVNDITIKQYAMREGIIKTGQEMTTQQKVQARYIAIMDLTRKAQGDLARTIDSPINKLRIMQQQIVNLAIDIGTALLPMFDRLITMGTNVAKFFSDLSLGTKSALAYIGLFGSIGLIAVGALIKLGMVALQTSFYLNALAASAMGATTMIKALQWVVTKGTVPFAILTAALTVLGAAYMYFAGKQDPVLKKLKDQENAVRALADVSQARISQQKQEAMELRKLGEKYDELTHKAKLNNKQQNELKSLTEEIRGRMEALGKTLEQQPLKWDGTAASVYNFARALEKADKWQLQLMRDMARAEELAARVAVREAEAALLKKMPLTERIGRMLSRATAVSGAARIQTAEIMAGKKPTPEAKLGVPSKEEQRRIELEEMMNRALESTNPELRAFGEQLKAARIRLGIATKERERAARAEEAPEEPGAYVPPIFKEEGVGSRAEKALQARTEAYRRHMAWYEARAEQEEWAPKKRIAKLKEIATAHAQHLKEDVEARLEHEKKITGIARDTAKERQAILDAEWEYNVATGRKSREQYLAYLQERLTKTKKGTQDYIQLQQQIAGVEKDIRGEQQATLRHQLAMHEISLADYEATLKQELAAARTTAERKREIEEELARIKLDKEQEARAQIQHDVDLGRVSLEVYRQLLQAELKTIEGDPEKAARRREIESDILGIEQRQRQVLLDQLTLEITRGHAALETKLQFYTQLLAQAQAMGDSEKRNLLLLEAQKGIQETQQEILERNLDALDRAGQALERNMVSEAQRLQFTLRGLKAEQARLQAPESGATEEMLTGIADRIRDTKWQLEDLQLTYQNVWRQSAQGAQQAIGDFLYQATQGIVAWGDLFNGILNSINRVVIDLIAQRLVDWINAQIFATNQQAAAQQQAAAASAMAVAGTTAAGAAAAGAMPMMYGLSVATATADSSFVGAASALAMFAFASQTASITVSMLTVSMVTATPAALALAAAIWQVVAAETALAAVEGAASVARGLIPGMAEGGIVTQPTLALLGEQGPEAVIPLSGIGRGGGGVTINLHVIDTQTGFEFLMKHMGDIAVAVSAATRENAVVTRRR